MSDETVAAIILIVNMAATWFMVGVIWMVQVVQYPGFRNVNADDFVSFHRHHSVRIGFVVVPAMTLELASSFLLLWRAPVGVGNVLVWLGVGCSVLVWVLTMAIQVPKHQRLAKGADVGTIDALVSSNWLRTGVWTVHGVFVAAMLAQVL